MYRYQGQNGEVDSEGEPRIKNYICLKYDTTNKKCVEDYMYRIIGIVPETNYDTAIGVQPGDIKVIKEASIGTKQWHSSNVDITWADSSLKSYLNSTFITILDDVANNIRSVGWYYGSSSYADSAKAMYDIEKKFPTVDGKVGLMYISEYGWAGGTLETSTLEDGLKNSCVNTWGACSSNWMRRIKGYDSIYEWTIHLAGSVVTTSGTTYYKPWWVDPGGTIHYFYAYENVTTSYHVRPTFYLMSNTEILGGEGTEENPYYIRITTNSLN